MSYEYHDEHRDAVAGDGSRSVWTRGLTMLLFIFALGIANPLLYALAFVQFLWMLLKSERNVFIAGFGRSLAAWIAETARFITGDTEEKPFPWKAWP
jgi:Domain of unknown function (DUF4389)